MFRIRVFFFFAFTAFLPYLHAQQVELLQLNERNLRTTMVGVEQRAAELSGDEGGAPNIASVKKSLGIVSVDASTAVDPGVTALGFGGEVDSGGARVSAAGVKGAGGGKGANFASTKGTKPKTVGPDGKPTTVTASDGTAGTAQTTAAGFTNKLDNKGGTTGGQSTDTTVADPFATTVNTGAQKDFDYTPAGLASATPGSKTNPFSFPIGGLPGATPPSVLAMTNWPKSFSAAPDFQSGNARPSTSNSSNPSSQGTTTTANSSTPQSSTPSSTPATVTPVRDPPKDQHAPIVVATTDSDKKKFPAPATSTTTVPTTVAANPPTTTSTTGTTGQSDPTSGASAGTSDAHDKGDAISQACVDRIKSMVSSNSLSCNGAKYAARNKAVNVECTKRSLKCTPASELASQLDKKIADLKGTCSMVSMSALSRSPNDDDDCEVQLIINGKNLNPLVTSLNIPDSEMTKLSEPAHK